MGRNLHECKPSFLLFISAARPASGDSLRQPIRLLLFLIHSLPLSSPLFPSLLCTAPCAVCPSLPSQWPILHHRWARQKGEATARLLFGERRRRAAERRGGGGGGGGGGGARRVIYLRAAPGGKDTGSVWRQGDVCTAR